jgi:hypothetical protein
MSRESSGIIRYIDSKIVWSHMVLKSGFRFQMMLLLGVLALNALDPLMVGYLLELFWELPPPGPNMLMRQASITGFQQTMPPISG